MPLVTARRLLGSVSSVSSLLQVKSPKEGVTVQGWVQNIQQHPSFYFLKVNDGLCARKVQVVVPEEVVTSGKPQLGAAVSIRGNWVTSKGRQQEMELLASQCTICGSYEGSQVEGPNDTTRGAPHLRIKNPAFAALFRLRSRLNHLSHNFFMSSKHSDFFATGSDIFLPVSTQLHLEAMTGGIPNVYTLTPVFRADNSIHALRLAEFRMLEAECAFVNSVEEIMCVLEEYLKFVVRQLLKFEEDIGALEKVCDRSRLNLLNSLNLDSPIPRLRFSEAASILARRGQTCSHSFDKNQELQLVKEIGGPLFVTHLPCVDKPFYMKKTDDGEHVLNVELLAPLVGELAGGSVREDDCNLLFERVKGSPYFDWYIEFRRCGYPRSSGFGLGFERLIQSVFGLQNIKETVPFPRWYKGMKC